MSAVDPLAVDLAVHKAVDADKSNLALIARKHGLTPAEMRRRVADPGFAAEMAAARGSMEYARGAHQLRCASVAELMLEGLVALYNDAETQPGTRVKIYELIRKDAGLEHQEEAVQGTAVQIHIDLSGAAVYHERQARALAERDAQAKRVEGF